MGFELEEDHFHLFFEDARFDGLEVVIARMSIRESLAFDKARFTAANTLEEVEARMEKLAKVLGEQLVSWNLAKRGRPVPCTAAGILAQDERILDAIIDAYIQAVRGVAAPLALSSSDTGSSSTDGSSSEGLLPIPMEPLSESL